MKEGLSRRGDAPKPERQQRNLEVVTEAKHRALYVKDDAHVMVGNALLRTEADGRIAEMPRVDRIVLKDGSSSIDITQASARGRVPDVVLQKGDAELKCHWGTTVVVIKEKNNAKGVVDTGDFVESDSPDPSFRLFVHPQNIRTMYESQQPPHIVIIRQAEETTLKINSTTPEARELPHEGRPEIADVIFD